MSRLLPDWLLARASADPVGLALKARSARWSNRELLAVSDAVAAMLRRDQVAAGSRVAAVLADDAAAIALAHAVRRLGAVLVPLNRRAAPGELAYQFDTVGARVVVFDVEHEEAAASARRLASSSSQQTRLLDIQALEQKDLDTSDLRTEVDLDSAATILFTSGTTARPKGAVLTHGNHVASADAWADLLQPRATDRWLACVPLFHVAGVAIVVRAARWGVPLEVHERFDAGRVAAAVTDGVSHLSLVPVQLAATLQALEGLTPPPTLRAILLGGGPIPQDLLRRARGAGYPVVTTYGMTETASGVVAGGGDDETIADRGGGRPLAGVDIRIAAGTSNDSDTGGEVLIRGAMVFAGYVASRSQSDQPVEIVPGTRAEWHASGDIGHLDERGLLHIDDRRVDMLVSGGENVYPAEVEMVLLAHPDISDAGVVGIPDPEWGAVPVAAIVVRDGALLPDATLERYCRTQLAGYKVPRRFHRHRELPRTAAGKLERRELRAALTKETM